jgi:CxxC motif-containing protein
MKETELFASLNKYSELIRHYFMRVKPYQGHLISEFDLEELKSIIEKKKAKVVSVLKKVFASSFEKYLSVEKDKNMITKRNIILLMEELRNLALQTSQVEPGDLVKEVKEIAIPAKAGAIEKVIIMITNAYIALQYEELEIAKKKYLELLTVYEKLSVKEQESVFEDISRLYNNISYVNSWLEKPKEA